MAASYDNDLRLKEIETGSESGTWGTSTNTNPSLIADAFGYSTQASFGSDANVTTTVADGSADPARAMYFKVTSGASLTATRTLTIEPNTISRVMFIENATTGSQSIAISQGSGANITIATGKSKLVYLDGAGSGAAVVDALVNNESTAAATSGTFTPTLGDDSSITNRSQAYNIQVGNHTKVGNRLFFDITLELSSKGSMTASNQVHIGGLPEACKTQTSIFTTVNCGVGQGFDLAAAGYVPVGSIGSGHSYIRMGLWDGTAGPSALLVSELTTGTNNEIVLSGSYPVS